MNQENEFVTAYKKVFPNAQPNIFQMEMIEFEIHDREAWKEALKFWALNDYRPQSVGKIIDYYKQVLKDRKPNWRSVGKWDGTEAEPIPPCGTCGREYCLSNHLDEQRAA